MIHILFGASASGSLKYVLREKGLDQKEKVISFWDLFSIGPVWQLHEEEGLLSRTEWMKNCISYENDEFYDYVQSYKEAINQIISIQEGAQITIWISDNASEQTGLRYVIHLLKRKNINLTLINTTKGYEGLFRAEKVKYTLLHTGEIPPEKLQVIYEQYGGKCLNDHDREVLEKEWLSLSESQETVRIWRNGRIQCVSEDYFDLFIIERAKDLHRKPNLVDFMKSARLIGDVLGHIEQHIGDSFLEYRLKKLIEAGVFEGQGSLKAMRFYSVRLKQ